MQAETSNPIKQDVKNGNLRNYPYSIPWNYGMLPQTWEDPKASHAALPGIGVGHSRLASMHNAFSHELEGSFMFTCRVRCC